MTPGFAIASVIVVVLLVGLAGGYLLNQSINQQTSSASNVRSPTITLIASSPTNTQTTASNNQTLATSTNGSSSYLSQDQSLTPPTNGSTINVVIG